MRINSQLRFKRTTVIICGLLAFLTGLGLARLKFPVQAWLVWFSFLTVGVTFRLKNLMTIVCVVSFGIIFGLWRGGNYLQKLSIYQAIYYQKVTIVGSVESDGVYDKSQLSFDIVSAKSINPEPTDLVGKIGVKGFGENAVFRGDTVRVLGKLYPARGSRQARISYAQVVVIKRSSSIINQLRRKFEAGMLSALPEPLASFGLGLLVGQRNNLPKTVNDELSAAGLTHIVAVSGYNLTIIMGAVYFLLKKFSKYQATLGSVLLILLFIIFAGASASIIRAAIVCLLSLWAIYFGRNFKPVMLILLAAAATAGWSPTYLWSDIGWYLSFLAFFGILVVAPLILQRFYHHKKPRLLASVIVETMAAQLMTIPIVMYIFGQISLVALPANILVVPLVPFAMALSFIAAMGGMIIPALAGWLAWPARIILTYMLNIVSLASKIPNALSLQSIKGSQLIGLYALIIAFCWLLWFKNRHKNARITDELTEEI